MVYVGDNVQNHPRDGIRPPAAGERGAAAAACPARLGSEQLLLVAIKPLKIRSMLPVCNHFLLVQYFGW